MEPLAAVAALSIPVALLYSWWRKAPITLTLAVAMLVTFILGYIAARSSPAGGEDFLLSLAVFRIGPVHSEPWTYVTMMFIHADLTHLLFNLLFLIFLGPMLEERIGPFRWGVLFLAGGVFATVVFELLQYQSPVYVLLGASGALSAVFGAFGRLYPWVRIRLFVPFPLPLLPVLYYVIGFVVLEFFLALVFRGSGIAWEAHVAGLVFGFATAPIVMRIPDRTRVLAVRDFSGLRPLVMGRDLEEIYDHLSRESLREAQEAWLEKFARKAKCPQCGLPLNWSRGSLRSECGWKLKVG